MVVFAQSGCIRPDTTCIGAKVVVFGQGGCIRPKVVALLGKHKWFARIRQPVVARFGQPSGSRIQPICAQSTTCFPHTISVIRAKYNVLCARSGCTSDEVQPTLGKVQPICPDTSGCIREYSGCIWGK